MPAPLQLSGKDLNDTDPSMEETSPGKESNNHGYIFRPEDNGYLFKPIEGVEQSLFESSDFTEDESSVPSEFKKQSNKSNELSEKYLQSPG